MKQTFVLLLMVAACGGGSDPGPTSTWRIDARASIPDGVHLEPDDLSGPAEAAPSAMVRTGNDLWVAYAHLRAYRPAGPGWLARHDATTLERTALVKLVQGEETCRNPVALHLSGDALHVACAGLISFGEPSDDGLVMTVSLDGTITQAGRVGHSPGSITRVGDTLWLGDGERGGLWRVDALTLSGAEHLSPCVVDDTHQGYVADVLAWGERLFAACFNDDTVVELDPSSGAVVGSPLPTGDAPIKLARLGDLLYVLDNLGGTLTVIDPREPPVSRAAALSLGRDGAQGGNDPQGLAGDATVAGVTNSAWGTFVVLDLETMPPTLSAAVDLKPSADAPSNFPTAVTYEDGVFHVLVPGLELDTNDVPGELVRIVRTDP